MRAFRTSAVAGLVLLTLVAPARAGAAPAGYLPHRAGLKPIAASATPAAGKTLTVRSSAGKGVVSPRPTVYLVFWGSQWSTDPAKEAPALQSFFTDLHGAVDNFDTILTQYCEGVPAGTSDCGSAGIHIKKPKTTSLAGAWFDNASAEPTNATASQIAAEAVRAAKHFGNTSQKPNYNAQYAIVSAHNTHPDGFPSSGFCGWHDFTTSTYGKLAFTNLPYVPDLGAGACTTIGSPTLLDGLFSTETHEYSETVTDFWPSIGWNGSGGEIADECTQLDARIKLPSGKYDVQGDWSNAANKCVTSA